MKIKKIAVAAAAMLAALPSFAERITAESYAFPFVLKIDSKDVVSKNTIVLPRANLEDKDANLPIKDALFAILNQTKNFEKHLANPKDAPKARSFIKKLGDPKKVQITNCVFWKPQSEMLAFFNAPDSKLRPDMNYIALKYDGGIWKWDVGAKNTFISILSESERNAKPEKVKREPYFSDINFIDISGGKNADLPVLKFYKDAQAEFYKLNLPAYAEIMTPKSKEVYTAQYLSMTPDEQKDALKDYITYHKQFKFIARFKEADVIVFTREKDGKVNSYDAAFIVRENGQYRLANFGQNQGFVADMLINISKNHSDIFGH
ncbi:MAG: hypothetical protein IKO42_05225 [Opitutales bacterium]|nr:hypothetical protein [Opitutales bacterium]